MPNLLNGTSCLVSRLTVSCRVMSCHVMYRSDQLSREVTVCLVGKYTRLEDSYASVVKALSHAALACRHRLDLKVISLSESHKSSIFVSFTEGRD